MIKYGTPNHERNSDDSPTPKMFVTYLLDTVKEAGPLSIYRHWRPQYALFPFCSVSFDYVAAIEDMDTHMAFLADLFRFPVILVLLSNLKILKRCNIFPECGCNNQSFNQCICRALPKRTYILVQLFITRKEPNKIQKIQE